jgi:RNA polymerase sigma-70 factor (ECF subfamily)
MTPQAARIPTGREEILARLRERIVAFAASRLPRDVAEDLAQEVLLLLHEKYSKVEALEDLLPLCLRILRFKMLERQRKAYRRGERTQVSVDDLPLAGGEPDPETWLERKEMAARLAAAVARLGPRCKELLRLKLEGKSFEEIRVLLGAGSINTIYTWDHRCRKQLQEWIGASWEKKA